MNAHEQQYINVGDDAALAQAVYEKGAGDAPEFVKREDALRAIRGHMQVWHEVRVGGELVRRCVRPLRSCH